MKDCLRLVPSERPTAEQLLEHSMFKDFSLRNRQSTPFKITINSDVMRGNKDFSVNKLKKYLLIKAQKIHTKAQETYEVFNDSESTTV